MKKLILIDGNSIFHRAFYAIPPLTTPDGQPSNAAYGFTSMLLNILNNEKPDCIAVAFDVKGGTFRHKEYKEYKAQRAKAPDELYAQIPMAKKVLRAFKIPIYELQGFEADDLLGTLATQAEQKGGIHTYIITGDKDALQLVTDKTTVIMPVRGFSQTEHFTPAQVKEKFGLAPAQIPDQKGLQGDASDNIKGVPGIGKKTAASLLQEYHSIEGIYKSLDKITGKVKENLQNHKEDAFLSKHLATIVKDVPQELNIEACKVHRFERSDVEAVFDEYGFKRLIPRFNTFDKYYEHKRNEDNQLQQALF